MSEAETRRCEWCGDIARGACGCPAEVEIDRLRAALTRIARWHGEFTDTGRHWDEPENTRPMSYSAAFGSNGERDYMRQVALDALGHNAAMTGPAGVQVDEPVGQKPRTEGDK